MTRTLAIGLVLLIARSLRAQEPVRPPLGRLVNVNGHPVHLYCSGTASPTVIVVGGAFSFDWGLVQPEVAKFARICTYDPSGTAWSPASGIDQQQTGATPRCQDRVTEIHDLLHNAGIGGPYVLVGFSIGGLIGRLYSASYPDEVAGMVIVDHAFTDVASDAPRPPPVTPDSPPVLISSTPITLELEDDHNFAKLPKLNQDLHTWAMSIHPLRPTAETAIECTAAVDSKTQGVSQPLGDKPLTVISTTNDLPAYQRLQKNLLWLSRNSKQIIAYKSSHMVIIDEPEIITNTIREIVAEANEPPRSDRRVK